MENRNDDEMEIDLLKLAKALWRRAWAIMLAAVIFGGAALTYTAIFVTPLYKAEALMYVNSSNIRRLLYIRRAERNDLCPVCEFHGSLQHYSHQPQPQRGGNAGQYDCADPAGENLRDCGGQFGAYCGLRGGAC